MQLPELTKMTEKSCNKLKSYLLSILYLKSYLLRIPRTYVYLTNFNDFDSALQLADMRLKLLCVWFDLLAICLISARVW